jgi:hypothetical protein
MSSIFYEHTLTSQDPWFSAISVKNVTQGNMKNAKGYISPLLPGQFMAIGYSFKMGTTSKTI